MTDSATPRIDFDRVREVKRRKDALHADPASAIAHKTVSVSLVETFRKMGHVRGFEVPSDEPREAGGEDSAPQPTEFMLLSLAFCQMNLLIHCAGALRVQLDDIRIDVTGHRDNRGLYGGADVRVGYFRIDMRTELVSDEPHERLVRLAELAESRCPVTDNLAHPTPLAIEVVRGGETVRQSTLGTDAPSTVEAHE
jgi:uncharacterized OsmC-like protein